MIFERNKKKCKKGQFRVPLILIVTLVAAFLIAAIVYKMVVNNKNIGDSKVCQISITAADALSSAKKKTVNQVDLVPSLKCPPKYRELKIKDAIPKGRRTVSDDQIKKVLADEMVECWEKVGRGNLDPFKKATVTSDFDSTCLTCAIIYPDKKLAKRMKIPVKDPRTGKVLNKDGQKYPIKGLGHYLATNKAPLKGMSYYQYIYGKQPSNAMVAKLKSNSNVVYSFNEEISLGEPIVVFANFLRFNEGMLESSSVTFLLVNAIFGEPMGDVSKVIIHIGNEDLMGKTYPQGKLASLFSSPNVCYQLAN